MTNREVILKITEAFDKNNADEILSLMTDDAEWLILGDQTISGRDNLKAFFDKNADMQILSCTKDHIIADGDSVSVDGNVQCRTGNGTLCDMYYCDIYDLQGGKVNKMTSYCVQKKK